MFSAEAHCTGGVGQNWQWGPCSSTCGFGVQCRRPPGGSNVEITTCVGTGGAQCRGSTGGKFFI